MLNLLMFDASHQELRGCGRRAGSGTARHARPRSGDGGHDFFGLARKNGGAPSSLTRPQSLHHDRTSARETSPTSPPRSMCRAKNRFPTSWPP